MKLKPLQRRWLSEIGKAETGKLGFHLDGKANENALNALLGAKLIRIETAFEGGLYIASITETGREALATT